jgi:putative nucleotidyltransferase with HDIG domain
MKKTARTRKTTSPAKIKQLLLNIFLLAGVWGVLLLLVCCGNATYGGQLQEGDIALQTVYAPFDFSVKGEADQEKTDQLRHEAAAGVKFVYDLHLSQAKPKFERIDSLIQSLSEIQKIREATLQEKEQQFSEKLKPLELSLSSGNMETLMGETALPDWTERLKKSLEELLTLGVFLDADKKALLESKIQEVVIRDIERNQEAVRPVSEIFSLEEAKPKIEHVVFDHFPESRKSRSAAIEILGQLIAPSLSYHQEETEKRKKEAWEVVQTVHKVQEIKKNELIVSRGQKLSRKPLTLLVALEKEASLTNKVENTVGMALLVALLIVIFIFSFRRYDPKILQDYPNLLMLGTVAVSTIALAKAATLSPFSSFLIPIPMASILTTILLNPSAAMMMTLLLSLLAATMVSQKFGLILVAVFSGLTAVYFTSRVRRRSDILKAGIWAGIAGAVGVIIISLISGLQIKVSIHEGIWGMANGIMSAIIVIGTLPAFESLFKITTNISLLELSDLNHPILRQLFIQAPGTYHHSLVVGNLAESACEVIGANALLSRVGAYYHDIGKMEKAEYFTENQIDTLSKQRHEKLSPHMSSLIIVNHIKNGIELAQQFKLPKRIIDFVPEHQGTSLIYFFYQKALHQAKEGEVVKEENFRYPGPKAQSKETAVVLLADSVEAASRSLEDPTPARISGLVRKMINNKFIDGQLDECNLTLRDLNTIAETFIKVLTGVFHTRVPYPEREESSIKREKK